MVQGEWCGSDTHLVVELHHGVGVGGGVSPTTPTPAVRMPARVINAVLIARKSHIKSKLKNSMTFFFSVGEPQLHHAASMESKRARNEGGGKGGGGSGGKGSGKKGSGKAGPAQTSGKQSKKGKDKKGGGHAGGGGSRKRPQFGRPPARAERDSTAAMPRMLHPLEFAEARASEVKAMVDSLRSRTGTKRIHQMLPRHMRRRAMSYNIKRLPVRLRAAGLRETADTLSPTEKQRGKSRRHRRRLENLRLLYEARGARVGWLETHIWHAKRMHMVNKWGLRLALSSCEKSVRAAHRAVNHACLVHDASHIGTIELTGGRDAVLRLVNNIVSPAVHPDETGGEVELCRLLRHPGEDGPLVCPVTMLWRQGEGEAGSGGGGDGAACVWVQVPAAAFAEAFELVDHQAAADNAVCVVDRRNELLRFELTGPRATDVIRRVLAPEGSDEATRRQREVWEVISAVGSASSFRPRVVLSLLVSDPRLTACAQGRPAQQPQRPRSAAERAEQMAAQRRCVDVMANWPPGVARSTLWSPEVRAAAKKGVLPIAALHERRRLAGAPGAVLQPQPTDVRVPILLVQRPGTTAPPSWAQSRRDKTHRRGCQSGYGNGWDLIVPAGWGMAFWLPLVYGGGRAIGLRERCALSLEKGVPSFPQDFPDTASAKADAAEAAAEARRRHNRRPPKRRVNYEAIGIPTPFHTAWAELVGLRCGDDCKWPSCAHESAVRVLRLHGGLLDRISTARDMVRSKDKAGLAVAFGSSLMCVQVSVMSRGVPRPNAILYIPTEDDLRCVSACPTTPGIR